MGELIFFYPSLIFMQIQEPSDAQIPEFAKMLANAVLNKNYLVVAGIILMFVVILFKKIIIPKLGNEEKYKPYIPLITFAISIITGVATWILNPTMNPMDIMTTVIGATTIASGSWETMLKPIVKKFFTKAAPAPITLSENK